MKTFKEFISEAPEIDTNLHPANLNSFGFEDQLLSYVSDGSAKKIGNNLYHFNYLQTNFYFHVVSGKIREYSIIVDNVHQATSKKDGDVKTIFHFMKTHILKYGLLKSDSRNTRGSQKLWISFIKSNPNIKFRLLEVGRIIKDLNSSNIEELSDLIWSSAKYIIEAYK